MSKTMRPLEIHGHRGARGLAPENTLAGVRTAIAHGVDAVEIDCLVTADQQIVLFHDFNLNPDLVRLSDGRWLESSDLRIVSSTLSELRKFKIGQIRPQTKYAQTFPAQVPHETRIPTLAELCRTVADSERQIYLTIEIKSSPLRSDATPPPDAFAKLVLDALKDLNRPVETDLITSFDWRILAAVQEREPELRTSFLTIQQPDENTIAQQNGQRSVWTGEFDVRDFNNCLPEMVASAGGNGWSPYYKDVDRELVEIAHSFGLFVCVWTVNNSDDIQRMIDADVDVIITDYPDKAQAIKAQSTRA